MQISTYIPGILTIVFAVAAQAETLSVNQSPIPDRIAQSSEPENTSNKTLTRLELATYNLVNRYRAKYRLSPLVINPDLTLIAKEHSRSMSESRKMTHAGFSGRVAAVSRAIPSKFTSENLAFNAGSEYPQLRAIRGWIESPSHRNTMLGNYDLTGIGVEVNSRGEYYFTQLFVLKNQDGTVSTQVTESSETSDDQVEKDESAQANTSDMISEATQIFQLEPILDWVEEK
jgi:uncharacterized protein YkwD